MCRLEGDGKGSVKFLVQHSSAALHLQAPPSRYAIPSHIPPVLPDQESFRSPGNHRARSVRSNHDSKSSTSEHYYVEAPSGNFEESASDEDPFDKDRQRNTIRPPQQAGQSVQYFNPSSPLDQRRIYTPSARDPSPPKLSLSPGRARNADALSPVVMNDRNRLASTPVNGQFSPNRPYDDGSFTPPPSRRVHNYSTSDVVAERERALEQAERERMPRKVDRMREAQSRRRAYDGSEGSLRRTDEPWVVVKNNGRSASNARPGLHTPSNSHPSEMTGRFNNYTTFSSSRSNLPLVPPPPRNAPPPIPTSGYSNRPGQAVPPNWPVKGIPGLGENPRLQPSKNARLQAAKSMDNLRGMNSPMLGAAQRKQSQNSMNRPSIAGLREAASSSGSFMNMEMSPPSSRRDPALPRSAQDRTVISSPTAYTPRPLTLGIPQSQSDNSASSLAMFSNRPPPIQVQPSNSSSTSTYLNVSGGQGPRKSPEDVHARSHSALDDIGASPAPSRHVRPLPSTGNHGGSQCGSNSWFDVDSIFEDSPHVTSPHPYDIRMRHSRSKPKPKPKLQGLRQLARSHNPTRSRASANKH